MNEMIERGAARMAQREGLDWAALPDNPCAPNNRPLFRQRVRVAVSEMRDPTEAVILAIARHIVDYPNRVEPAEMIAEHLWEDAIEAALGDSEAV